MIERVIRTADGHSLGDLQSSQSNTLLPRGDVKIFKFIINGIWLMSPDQSTVTFSFDGDTCYSIVKETFARWNH